MASKPRPSRQKRDVKELIKAYFLQLTVGCGAVECNNEFCVSSAKCQIRSADEAALFAIELAKRKARVCYQGKKHSPPLTVCPAIVGLQEEELVALVERCKNSGNNIELVHKVGHVFSTLEELSASFVHASSQPQASPATAGETTSGSALTANREDASAAAGPLDSRSPYRITVNLPSLRRAYRAVMSLVNDDNTLESSFLNAVVSVLETLSLPTAFKSNKFTHSPLNAIVSILELPFLQNPLFLESVLPTLVRVTSRLPSDLRVMLVHFYSVYEYVHLKQLVTALHQFIAFTVVMEDYSPRDQHRRVNDDVSVRCAVSLMEIIFTASAVGGKQRYRPQMHTAAAVADHDEVAMAVDEPCAAARAVGSPDHSSSSSGQPRRNRRMPTSPLQQFLNAMMRGIAQGEEDADYHIQGPRLLDVLGIDLRYCEKPVVPFEEFYSEPLSSTLDFPNDYMAYRARENDNEFSFLAHPYVLAPSLKVQALAVDNTLRQRQERRQMLLLLQMGHNLHDSFLRLRVRRDHLVIDTLALLEAQCADDPHNLKKQLFVEFEGEQGIDEGGVQKEFFQLMIEQLFNPDFGMFILDNDTRLFWFNPTSFEQESQYTLIGMLLGLAIYNGCILDVHFPPVVYRKLMGVEGTITDLHESHPVIARSMEQMLEYDKDDFEEAFSCTFMVSHTDIFGQILTHELKENGSEIAVTTENRREYVDLACDYLLNRVVETQFRAFRKGFMLVTDDSPLSELFLPSELELLICGIDHLDMKELENGTHYDGGYSRNTPVVRFFWETVYSFTDEQKRQLLAFCTGSDRVPVGGLEQLHFIIAKNGGDSDRLPTAHTCFNVLLLPEYKSKERLADRLIKAITHAKGFGLM